MMYEEQIERGAALLDQVSPGWEAVIDPTTLGMDDCKQCVLGQVMGEYDDACQTLGIDGSKFGFDIGDGEDLDTLALAFDNGEIDMTQRSSAFSGFYLDLEEGWLEVTKRRLDAGIAL